MKNKINLVLVIGTILLAILTLCGYRVYDTENNLWDRIIVATLWIGVGVTDLNFYFKKEKL